MALTLTVMLLKQVTLSAAEEAVKKWDGGRAPHGKSLGMGLAHSPVMRVWGITPGNFLENTAANLCNLVHFWPPVQQNVQLCV